MNFLILCKALVFVTFSGVQGVDESVDEHGIIHADEAWGLPFDYPIMDMQNTRFPGMAPAKLIQTWRYQADPGGALRVRCHHISLPKYSDGSCGSYSLTLEDGSDTQILCGSIAGLNILSKTNDIKFTLRTGDQGRGLVNCTVQARQMGPYGEVTEPPTTQPPLPAFMTMESEEIDSSEFGGPPGRVCTTCPCGMANKHVTRIISGEEAKVNEYPFAVILTLRAYLAPFCGGSIITQRHVLTASHCFVGKNSNDIAVRMGDHDYRDEVWPPRKVVNVREIIRHEAFVYINQYDIALLILEEAITFNKYISPVCLPSKRLSLDWQYLTAMGWGRVGWGPNDGSSPYLKKVRVRAVPLALCAEHTHANATDPHQICTYGRNRGQGKGDSGGPVVWLDPETNRYTIVGLTSFGYSYASESVQPDVNADVSSFLPWIQDKIRRTDSSAVTCRSLN